MRLISAKLYLLFGIVLLTTGFYVIFRRTETITTSIKEHNSSRFVLQIPAANIYLPVIPARIVGNTWQTTTKGVSYLESSPLPGEYGNSVLYGHNWDNILGRLSRVRPGDIIVVKHEGKSTKFTVRFVTMVQPDDTGVYAKSTDTRLTIYTCAGLLDSKRLVITALKSV